MKNVLSTFNFVDFKKKFSRINGKYDATDIAGLSGGYNFIVIDRDVDCDDYGHIVVMNCVNHADAYLIAKRMNCDDDYYLKQIFEYCKYERSTTIHN